MMILVCSLFVCAMAFAAISSRDMFSPGKFYLLSFLVFYAGALASPPSYELWLLILVVLLVGILTVLFEALHPVTVVAPQLARGPLPPEKHFVRWIWLLSVPALASQLYILHTFGGIEGYAAIIGNRVLALRGLGWAKTFTSTITVFNLLYFAIGLTRRRRGSWWLLYLLHVLIVLGMGLLSGSRSSLLNVFAVQMFIYHYVRRPVKIRRALPVGLVLIALAMVLGAVREGVRLDNGSVSASSDTADKILRLSIFKYGVDPLEILLDTDHLRLAYGSTLLSVATNAVPRDWWPEKPDTGGVFFTKAYTGDEWDGASNITPTLLGEFVINFGWLPGMTLYFAAHLVMMWLVVAHYRRAVLRVRDNPDAFDAVQLVVYVLVMWSVVALMVGEVTNVLLGLVLTQLVPAFAFRKLLSLIR